MNEENIIACLDEVEAVLEDSSLPEKNGFTIEDMLSINAFKLMVLCFYHFRLYPVDKKILNLCVDAEETDEYDVIYGLVSDKWKMTAQNDVKCLMTEIETGAI